MSEKIIQFLDTASRHYYNGDPIISDEQFDRLADSVGYGSVGAKQHSNTEKHYYRMYSLQKFYEDEGKQTPLVGEKDVCVSPKLDGAAISLLYIDGKLVRALTRGDGIEGKVITDKFLRTKLVPHEININGIIQVTGEVVAQKTVENARNYAAGSLNLKDIEEFATRSVEFFGYSIYPYQTDTYDGDMQVLKNNGFNTVQDSNLIEIYPSDGLVFKVNSNKRFEELGFTSSSPRGSYAKKERADLYESILLDVEWGVGRTGRVTPVAILEPVNIDGSVVSRATLNNPGFIEALGLCVGDKVALRKAGMIIPEIVHKIEG